MNTLYGYCAVILPERSFWQGYFIHDTPELRTEAQKLLQMGLMMGAASSRDPSGIFQAALVEGVITRETGVIAGAALALAIHAKQRYFYVTGRVTGAGAYTDMLPLRANDPDAARQEIDNLPDVKMIKAVLLAQLMKETR